MHEVTTTWNLNNRWFLGNLKDIVTVTRAKKISSLVSIFTQILHLIEIFDPYVITLGDVINMIKAFAFV